MRYGNYIWLRSAGTYRDKRNFEPFRRKALFDWTVSKSHGIRKKFSGKRRVEVSAIANQKEKTIRDRDDSSLGKAIKGKQRTNEIGANAMWRPCFRCRFALREDTRKRKRRKRERREKCVYYCRKS